LVDSTPDDQLQPTWRLIDYAKPGDALDVRTPHLVDATTGRVVPLDPTHFPTPWSIDRVHWSKDGSYATFVYNQRGHEVVRLLKVDAATAAVTVVIEEKHGAFIDYVNALRIDHLPETGEALWMSERDGWRHVWLLDLNAGRIKRQVTRGPVGRPKTSRRSTPHRVKSCSSRAGFIQVGISYLSTWRAPRSIATGRSC
jgi:hypothetical protein